MGKVRTRSQLVGKKKPPKSKKSVSKPKSSKLCAVGKSGKRNPKLPAKSGSDTAAKPASKKGDVLPSKDSNDEDSEYEETETKDNDTDVETSNRDNSSSAEDHKVSAKCKCQGSNSPKKWRRGNDSRSDKRRSDRDSSTDAFSCRSSSSCSSSASSRKDTSKSMFASSLAKITQLFRDCDNSTYIRWHRAVTGLFTI
jgi:hypothetical protein